MGERFHKEVDLVAYGWICQVSFGVPDDPGQQKESENVEGTVCPYSP